MLKSLTAAALISLVLMLAATNVWFAACRSTIPLRLDATVMNKEVRHEKHPPKDDVCLLDLGPAGKIQLDQEVFDRVEVGQRLLKAQWSRKLQANGQTIDLRWSSDARGMVWTMPLVCMTVLATWWYGRQMAAIS